MITKAIIEPTYWHVYDDQYGSGAVINKLAAPEKCGPDLENYILMDQDSIMFHEFRSLRESIIFPVRDICIDVIELVGNA